MTVMTVPLAWDRGVQWETVRTVAPTILPIDFNYLANEVLKVDDPFPEDGHLTALIRQAAEAYEEMTLRALMDQTWEQTLDRFPVDYIELQRPPLIAVESINYVDADGATQTLLGSPADFLVKPSRKFAKARIYPLTGATWPSTEARADAVIVTYRAGYATAAEVPYLVRAGIELFVGERYQNRLLSAGVNVSANPEAVLKLDRFWRRVF